MPDTLLEAPFAVRRDAHEIYMRAGFVPLARPERFMEINRPDVCSSSGG